jgi:hypothetical protein
MLLKCLSIQQPWAGLILGGEKLVENRTWIWMPQRDWKREGSVLLGIHASSGVTTWRQLTDSQREDYAPGWAKGDGPVGGVLGVVDLVQICRPKDLPRRLRKHKYAIHKPGNWCWVIENPRRFPRPIPAKGNVFINVEVPDELVVPL